MFSSIFLLAMFCLSMNSPVSSTIESPSPVPLKQDSFQTAEILSFLQSEASMLSSAQHSIGSFLRSKKIPVGNTPGSLRPLMTLDTRRLLVAMSRKNNTIECRVALGRAPLGSKLIAPCGCTGSSRWIQFSELNRLRRKDPDQWKACPTCMQRYDYRYFL